MLLRCGVMITLCLPPSSLLLSPQRRSLQFCVTAYPSAFSLFVLRLRRAAQAVPST